MKQADENNSTTLAIMRELNVKRTLDLVTSLQVDN